MGSGDAHAGVIGHFRGNEGEAFLGSEAGVLALGGDVQDLAGLALRGMLGGVGAAEGVHGGGKSAVFSGDTLMEAKNSAGLTGSPDGFTATAWANLYVLTPGQQQMVMAKNRYSLNERQ